MKNLWRVLFLFFFSISLSGQSVDVSDSSVGDTPHKIYYNHAALFLGYTTFDKNGNTFFSLGADYIHRWDPDKPWAFGLLGEIIFADHTEYLIAVAGYYHILSHWWVRAAPGVEFIQVEEHGSEDHSTKTETEFLFRIGTGYAFHVGRIVITPSVDIDFVRNNDALVWGLNLGYSF